MKSELKAKWVEALRSGEYQQCKGHLHDGTGYCCIGILHKLITGLTPPPNRGYTEREGDGAGFTPKAVSDLGLSMSTLVGMNDGLDGPQQNFSQIADWIEEHL